MASVRETRAGTGQVWLLSWSGAAAVTTTAGVQESFAKVHCSFRVTGDHPTRRGVELVRFSLSGASVEARLKPTGAISVMGGEGKGIVLDDERGRLRLDLDARINYESLDEYRGIDTQTACYYIPATEPCAALVEGVLRSPRAGMVLERARIAVACAAGEFGEVQAIEVRAGRIALRPIADFEPRYRLGAPGQWAPLDDANTDANICIQVNQKSMVFQPVGFRSSASDPSPSGGTAAAQFATAAAVWAKACVSIVVRPMIFVTNATLKTSSDLAAIRASYTDADPDAIEVFSVANALSAAGGERGRPRAGVGQAGHRRAERRQSRPPGALPRPAPALAGRQRDRRGPCARRRGRDRGRGRAHREAGRPGTDQGGVAPAAGAGGRDRARSSAGWFAGRPPAGGGDDTAYGSARDDRLQRRLSVGTPGRRYPADRGYDAGRVRRHWRAFRTRGRGRDHLRPAGADDLRPYTTQKLVEAALGLGDGLRKAESELSRLPQGRQTGLAEGLRRFFGTAEAFSLGRATKAEVLAAVRGLALRLEAVASLALRGASSG